MATPTRIYKVAMKDGTIFLVEAISQEQAIKIATAPLVESATIPTPLETIRLQAEGAKLVTVAPTVEIKGVKGHELRQDLLEEQGDLNGGVSELSGDGSGEALPPLGEPLSEQELQELPPVNPDKPSKRGGK